MGDSKTSTPVAELILEPIITPFPLSALVLDVRLVKLPVSDISTQLPLVNILTFTEVLSNMNVPFCGLLVVGVVAENVGVAVNAGRMMPLKLVVSTSVGELVAVAPPKSSSVLFPFTDVLPMATWADKVKEQNIRLLYRMFLYFLYFSYFIFNRYTLFLYISK